MAALQPCQTQSRTFATKENKEFSACFPEKMSRFPCTFNLQPRIVSVNYSKLKFMKWNMDNERAVGGNTDNEMIQKLNCLTWVYFQLKKNEKAREINVEVLEKVNWRNITAIGNRAFLSFMSGDEQDARDCISKLEMLAESEDLDALFAEAKANQAYVHTRLSGLNNIKIAVEEYTYALSKLPGSFDFKFGLGRVYRRLCNFNLNSRDTSIPFDQCHRHAIKHLSDVAESCPDETMKSMALSELTTLRRSAVLHLDISEINYLFKGKIIEQLCDEALNTRSEHVYVLTTCGVVWKSIQTDRAIHYLEKAKSIHETTKVCHELGKCYERKATSQIKRGSARGHFNTLDSNHRDNSQTKPFALRDLHRSWKLNFERPNNNVFVFVNSPVKMKLTLDIEDSNIQQAIQNYNKAIELSQGLNTPAIYSLGLLLRKTGDTERALQQFNKIINTELVNEENSLPILVSTLEQAGYCYFELAHAKQDKSLEKEAERKLTRAVGLASRLAAQVPEFKHCAYSVWHGFRTLEQRHESEMQCPQSVKNLFQLLYSVRKYDKAIKVIYTLLQHNEDELDDETFVQAALESMMQENRYENALAFLEMILTRPSYLASGTWRKAPMALRVMLKAAEARMKAQEGGVTELFHQVFQCVYFESSVNGSESLDNDQIGDILLLHDEWHNTEEGPSMTTRVARGLHSLISNACGLNVSVNSKRHCPGAIEMELLLEEAQSHRVCILLVGGEFEESDEYKHLLTVLHSIPCPTETLVRLVVKLEGQSRVADYVTGYRRFKLTEERRLLRLGEIKEADEMKTKLDEEDMVFVMLFFRFLVNVDE